MSSSSTSSIAKPSGPPLPLSGSRTLSTAKLPTTALIYTILLPTRRFPSLSPPNSTRPRLLATPTTLPRWPPYFLAVCSSPPSYPSPLPLSCPHPAPTYFLITSSGRVRALTNKPPQKQRATSSKSTTSSNTAKRTAPARTASSSSTTRSASPTNTASSRPPCCRPWPSPARAPPRRFLEALA